MNRKRLRELVYQKFDCHCAYCGKKLELKDMQVDHFVPILRGWSGAMNISKQKTTRRTMRYG